MCEVFDDYAVSGSEVQKRVGLFRKILENIHEESSLHLTSIVIDVFVSTFET